MSYPCLCAHKKSICLTLEIEVKSLDIENIIAYRAIENYEPLKFLTDTGLKNF